MNMKFFSGYARGEEGATAVEFALIAAIFLTFAVGIYAVGIYFLTWNRLQYGTETAARYAAVHDDATAADLEEIVTDSLEILSPDLGALTVSVEYTAASGISFVEVVSSYRFALNLPFLPAAFNNTQIEATSRNAIN